MRIPAIWPACVALVLLLNLAGPAASAESQAYGGIGLQVVPVTTGELVVLQVVHGTPASRKGIRPGDLIVQVDDRALVGSDFAEIIGTHLWGTPGTSVALKYMRPGVTGISEVVLKRGVMPSRHAPIPGVKLIEPGRN